jgi:hypothetical protein
MEKPENKVDTNIFRYEACTADLDRHSKGDLVLYDDHAAIVEDFENVVADLKRTIDRLEQENADLKNAVNETEKR